MMMFLQILLLLAVLCCSAQEPSPPSMLLNSGSLPNRSEVVLTAGTDHSFTLGCRGDGSAISVSWTSTAFKLRYNRLTDSLTVRPLDARHTGTYSCGYLNQSLRHLDSWVHIYVKDPAPSANLFVTPRSAPSSLKDGQDFLFECLLTDPTATDLGFMMQGDVARGRGSLLSDMNVTVDRHRGALIRDMKPGRGNYVCTASRDGKEYTSKPVSIVVTPRLRSPPTVSVSEKEPVRIVGEKMDITCITSNPNHFYTVTWTHTHIQALNVTKTTRQYVQPVLYMNKTVSVAAVEHRHGGVYTCTAINEAGAATATTTLSVLDGPYLRLYLQPVQNANISTHSMEENGSAAQASVSRDLTEVYGGGTTKVEVNGGQDVNLMLVIETYPALLYQRWTTPSHLNTTTHLESHNNRYKASLLLMRVRPEDRGTYTLQYSTPFYNNSYSLHLRVYQPPSAEVRQSNGSLTCHSTGYPLPTILWYICPAGVTETCGDDSTYRLPATNQTNETEDEVQTQLLLPATTDNVTVECVASSHVGTARDVYRIVTRHIRVHSVTKQADGNFSQTVIGVSSMAAVLFLLLLVAVYKYTQKPRYEVRWKIIESSHGNNYSFIDPTQLPYNQKWEFPRDRLRLGAVLGAGAFGKVVEATAYGLGKEDNTLRVAVKMLKPSAHSEEREALMSELKILSHLGYHDYIVNLLGACTLGGPMLMITEYCSHGDLLNFLRGRAQMFLDTISSVSVLEEDRELYKNMAAQQARIRTDSGISCGSEVFQEMLPMQTLTQADSQSDRRSDSWSLDVDDLILFSYQVVQGMEFLASRNCIHRDVAARNVLLTDHRVAKICDFGLARDIMNDDNYIVKGNARLPVKWMAPESIFECVYTVQSDVWSYGILLWEIFSLGKSPYPNIAVDANFYKMIKDGRHMSRPDFAPPELYQIMTHCWSLEPTERPTFSAIGQLIKRLLLMTNDVLSNHSYQPNYWNLHEGVAARREAWEVDEEECREAGGEALKKEDEAKEVAQQEAREEEPLMMTTKNVTNVYQHC